ncbi:hypothetical protein DFJ73DRAFT_840638 [Zopfochytrium polystomum]|nr:hypothetical protein DFJ73DRAFT_840638 [Zopfochytrium polystomum]
MRLFAAAGWVATTAAFAAPLVEAATAIQGTQCTAYSYNGTLCPASVMTYSTSVPTANQAATEAALSSNLGLVQIAKEDTNCFNSLVALACAAAFPQCDKGVTKIPCKSSCQTAVSTCSAFAQAKNLVSVLNAAVQNCEQLSSADTEPLPDTNCLAPAVIAAAATNGTTTTPTTTTSIPSVCPKFFKPASNLNFTSNPNCAASGCCVPCPATNYFYPSGKYDAVVTMDIVLNLISSTLMAYVAVSWSVLPGRRTHPGDIVLHFSLANMVWHSCHYFLLGHPQRIQCADEVTLATSSNNVLCGVMGAILVLAINAAVYWAAYMIFNLHATIVWRSSIFERFKPLGVVFCWGVAAVFTFIPLLLNKVDASSGFACVVAPDSANLLLFTMTGIFAFPAFFINTATMIYIIVVARASTTSQGGTQGSSWNANQDGVKPVSARRQILSLLKLNWRALLLGLTFILAYTTYFIFFNLLVIPNSNVNSTTPWVQEWSACVLSSTAATNQDTQTECANKVAKQNVPAYGLLVFANIITSTVGTITFFIFGANLQVLQDWILQFQRCCGGGRRRSQADEAMQVYEQRQVASPPAQKYSSQDMYSQQSSQLNSGSYYVAPTTMGSGQPQFDPYQAQQQSQFSTPTYPQSGLNSGSNYSYPSAQQAQSQPYANGQGMYGAGIQTMQQPPLQQSGYYGSPQPQQQAYGGGGQYGQRQW